MYIWPLATVLSILTEYLKNDYIYRSAYYHTVVTREGGGPRKKNLIWSVISWHHLEATQSVCIVPVLGDGNSRLYLV